MLCKLQYDRINNITKIMCLKKDYAFFWRLVYEKYSEKHQYSAK